MDKRTCIDCKIEKSTDEFHMSLHKRGIFYSSYCKPCHNLRNQNHNKDIRLKVINYYSNGTNECACCQENHLEFLTLDHINGDGAKHRGKVMGSWLYQYLVNNNFPDLQLRILCMNCNFSYGKRGYCPHNN